MNRFPKRYRIPCRAGDSPPELVETTPSHEAALDALWRPAHPELNQELMGRGEKR